MGAGIILVFLLPFPLNFISVLASISYRLGIINKHEQYVFRSKIHR